MIGRLLLLACMAAASLPGQGTTAPKRKPSKPCEVVLETLPDSRTEVQSQGTGQTSITIGGGVKLSCRGQNITLTSDSLISYDGYDTFVLIGRVRYRDDDYLVTTDTLRRYKIGERIELRGNAIVTGVVSGSVLKAPSVDYFRQVPKVNDVSRMVAWGRADALIYPKRTSGAKVPGNPYHVVADRLEQAGETSYQALGNAIVERDSLRVFGDSVKYLSNKTGMAVAWGVPARVLNVATDSARLQGLNIVVDMGADETIRETRAYREVVFVRDAARITSDTLQVAFDKGKVTDVHAWAAGGKARLTRDGYDSSADSLVVQSKNGRIDRLRLFRNGRIEQPVDSLLAARAATDSTAVVEREWITGGLVTVTFAETDSAGRKVTQVREILALRRGCSLSSNRAEKTAGDTTDVTMTYTCADTILVRMKEGNGRDAADVYFGGNTVGAILEPSGRVAIKPRGGTDA